MTGFLKGIVSLIGRLLLVAIFVSAAVMNKIPKFDSVVDRMAEQGIPEPRIMLAGAIVFLLVGGASVLVGFKARFGAFLLMVFLILASYYFHDFWTMQGQQMQEQQIQFMKNASMIGAMLLIIANGPGALSVDNWRKRAKAA